MDVLAEETGELSSSDPAKVSASLQRLITVFNQRDPASLIVSLPSLAKLVISNDNRNVRLLVYQVYRRIAVPDAQWGPIIPFTVRDCTGEDLELQIAAIRLLEVLPESFLAEMFKTQLSFPLLFKSNVVTVRRAALRALHTLLLARNMTSVIPNFVPRHCAMIKDVLFDDQDVGVFFEVCRLFAELLPELSDQTVSALDTPLQASKLHGDLGQRLAQGILQRMQLFMLRLSHLPVSERGPGVTVAAHCLLEYQRLADKGERSFAWDYPYPITMHIPDLVDNAITPLLYCRDPPVVYAAAMAICRVACKVHKRKDWVESAVYHLTGLLQSAHLSSLQRYRLLCDILAVLHLVETGDFYDTFYSLLRAAQLVDDSADRLEVLTDLFRVTELKNAHRQPGPSYWDRLFKDGWFAGVWSAEDSETFRHELVVAACEGFRALNVLPALQRLQNGMELLSSLVPCLFWSPLPVEKKPDANEKKEEKKEDKEAEKKKAEETAKQRAAEEALAEPRLSQQMFLRLLATLLPFVSADKTEPILCRILEGLERVKSDALCVQLCLFLAAVLPESIVANIKDTSRVDLLVLTLSKRFLSNPTVWADLAAQHRRHFVEGRLAEATALPRKPHETFVMAALQQLAVRSATPAYVATHLQDLVEIYRDNTALEKRSSRLLYQLRKQREPLKSIHAEHKRQPTDEYFAPGDVSERPFSRSNYDDCLLVNTLRIASGLSLRSYARSSLIAQRAALMYRVISAPSDPIIVSAAHLANPFTHRITVLLKVENTTYNDIKFLSLYPAVCDPLQHDVCMQTLLRIPLLPAEKNTELNTTFSVAALGSPSFTFRLCVTTADPFEANALEGYQVTPTFLSSPYAISMSELLAALHVEPVLYTPLWNRCAASFVIDVALPRGSTGTSLSDALEKQPFSLVATRSYADSMLASYATISWFDDVILLNVSQTALQDGTLQARLEFRASNATALASFQEGAPRWIATLIPKIVLVHKPAALCATDATPFPVPANIAAKYQAARAACGFSP